MMRAMMSILRNAWLGRCKSDDEWDTVMVLFDRYDWRCDKLWRWWHTFKFTVCYLLRIQKSGYGDPSTVEVAILDYYPTYNYEFGGGGEWTEIVVGHGIFRNWWFDIFTDGYP